VKVDDEVDIHHQEALVVIVAFVADADVVNDVEKDEEHVVDQHSCLSFAVTAVTLAYCDCSGLV